MNQFDELQLHRLATAVCGGLATDTEIRELDRLLSANPQARAMYIAYLDIHAALAERGHDRRRVEVGRDENLPAPTALSVASEAKDARTRRAVASSLHRHLLWGGAIAASILLAIPVVINGRSDEARGSGSSVNDGNIIPSVGVIHMDGGTLRMNIQNVGTLVVDGPAQMELESPMRLRVDQGRVKLRVTEASGHGFVVATPHGDVTDLGTEFAVDVGDLNSTNLVVFDGEVDLSIPRVPGEDIVQRLVGGEGVRFARSGQLDRIMSIFTGTVETFVPSGQLSAGHSRVIANVSDNLSANDTKRFYEIVPSGFAEDKVAYVDRPYEWNGVTKEGLPGYLVGGDYVRTFNDNKGLDFQLTVEVSRPCHLYVLWDHRVEAAPWLEGSFEKMEEIVGLDEFEADGRMLKDKHRGVGPGNSIGQEFLVWKRTVKQPGKVILGSLGIQVKKTAMYGVVVVGLGEVPAGPISPASIH